MFLNLFLRNPGTMTGAHALWHWFMPVKSVSFHLISSHDFPLDSEGSTLQHGSCLFAHHPVLMLTDPSPPNYHIECFPVVNWNTLHTSLNITKSQNLDQSLNPAKQRGKIEHDAFQTWMTAAAVPLIIVSHHC